ncbi:DUF3349 domain-containing protein [Mycobacterium shimoidei]|uniref:DUF3349 domain-containing protein n=1 Tax=Mycobacterium shimoidei TaxID=29313 RepID=UPI000A045F76|nr:DUF3349 domain-containing protein [Mycobacterium shimoidei]MCV7257271.1 DUF3349 domain-containing protein [Mycobacterium shimoidei]
MTPASAASSAASFLRSVVRWLQVGYPEGVPGPDRVALLALLRSTPLTEEQIEQVVDAIDEEVEGEIDRDVIGDFISGVTNYDASPENIARVAARLAAAGWPLAGIEGFPSDGTDEQSTPNGERSASQGSSQG